MEKGTAALEYRDEGEFEVAYLVFISGIASADIAPQKLGSFPAGGEEQVPELYARWIELMNDLVKEILGRSGATNIQIGKPQ